MASPSRPSVRFTPLDVPAIMMLAQMTNRISPAERAGEGQVDAGVTDERDVTSSRGCGTGRWGTAAPARRRRPPRGSGRPASRRERRPRLRCLEILMKSSRNPTRPSPVMRNRTSTPLNVGGVPVTRCASDVCREAGADDDRATHGGRAALGVVRGRAVVADELAVAAADEEPDEHRGAEQRADERDDGRDAAPPSRRALLAVAPPCRPVGLRATVVRRRGST